MGLIIFAIVLMFVLVGIGFAIVFTCLFVAWLFSLYFDRDERKRASREMDLQTQQTEQMVNRLKAQNQQMREQIARREQENRNNN